MEPVALAEFFGGGQEGGQVQGEWPMPFLKHGSWMNTIHDIFHEWFGPETTRVAYSKLSLI